MDFNHFITPKSVSFSLDGGQHLILNQPDRVWTVDAGKVDIFLSPGGTNRNQGRRRYLFSLAKGDTFFSFTPQLDERNMTAFLTASGKDNTQIREIRFSEVVTPDFLEKYRAEVSPWIAKLEKFFPSSLPSLQNWSLKLNTSLGLDESLKDFNNKMANLMLSFLKKEDAREKNEYRSQKARDRQSITKTLTCLSTVLNNNLEKDLTHFPGESVVFRAMAMVAARAGIPFEKDSPFVVSDNIKDDIDSLADKNHFRTRRIGLEGEWWRCDNGPLLGFMADDNRPVAIVQKSSSKYEIFDPAQDSYTAVNQEIAEKLSPLAVMFYRSMPHRPMDWKALISFGLYGCRKDFMTMLLAGITTGLIGLLIPIATGIIFSTLIPRADMEGLVQITLILIASAVATGLFTFVKGVAMVRMEGKMDLTLQAALWDRILSLPVFFFRDYTAGDLALRSMGFASIRALLSGITLNAILTLIFASFNLLLLFYYDWSMAVIALLLTAVGFLGTTLAAIYVARIQKSVFNIQGKLSGMALQFITGINKLRMTGSEDRAFSTWLDVFTQKKQLAYKSGTITATLTTFNSIFPVLVSMALFSWFFWKRSQYMPIADFLAFNTAYVTFQGALMGISGVLANTVHIFPLYNRLRPILDAIPEVDDKKNIPGKLSGKIEVNKINFRYHQDGPLVLKDISITVESGGYVAIVGGSGSGKSTLMRLLLGFEVAESGTLYFDDLDLASLDIRAVRKQIGVVLQDGKVMAGTIFNNIAGASSISLDEAWQAAQMAGLKEDIKQMPMGMHTMVPAGGGVLSGGQRQRLLIARAMARNPSLLFFDEATSALDNPTQAIVSASLETLKVTRITIAHRLSTILKADRIYVMDQGQIQEQGTYNELMAQKGFFYELAIRQIS